MRISGILSIKCKIPEPFHIWITNVCLYNGNLRNRLFYLCLSLFWIVICWRDLRLVLGFLGYHNHSAASARILVNNLFRKRPTILVHRCTARKQWRLVSSRLFWNSTVFRKQQCVLLKKSTKNLSLYHSQKNYIGVLVTCHKFILKIPRDILPTTHIYIANKRCKLIHDLKMD